VTEAEPVETEVVKPVADARAFLEATKGRETLTLTVRRLTATRVVRVSLRPEDNVPAADPDAPAFDDPADGAPAPEGEE